MKKFSKLAIILLMFAVLILSATACSAPTEVLIKEGDMPTRVSFVEGQELDLTGGKLTVVYKGKTETIALDSSDVKVTGYDKNKLGEQELTINYKNKTATLTITIVPRVSVENFEKGYLIGDSFDKSKGRIKIMSDSGSFQSILLNNSTVTIEGFDSSAAGTLTLTARYQSYSASFNVTVYEIENATFSKPSKTNYKSHDQGIDLNGSHITITGNGGKIERYIPYTAFLVSGFKLSAATIDNMTTPLSQTVSVSYLNQNFEFTVKIIFSEVSLIKKLANEISAIDWTGDEVPTITEAEGEKAIEAAQLYFNLSDYDKDFITAAEKEQVMRTAAVFGFGLWFEEANSFDQTFTIKTVNNIATISLVANSYNTTKDDLLNLKDSSGDFNVLGALLINISDNFFDLVLAGEDTIGVFLSSVPTAQLVDDTVSMLEFMTSVYEKLMVLPAEWTVEGLGDYGTEIEEANTLITDSIFLNNRAVFGTIASWRSDFFDIIYSYYYYHSDDGEAAVNGLALKNAYLPGLLENLYINIKNAVYETARMTLNQEPDTTRFMWHYRNALNFRYEVLTGENELYLALYDCLTFAGILVIDNKPASVSYEYLLSYIKTAEYGYIHHNGRLLSDPIYDNFWEMYLNALDKLFAGEEDYDQDVAELFTYFVEMSPAKQYGILASLNTYYIDYGVPEYSFDFSEYSYTVFVSITANHFGDALSQNAFEVYKKLLLALESYAQYQMGDRKIQDFLSFMGDVTTMYNALNTSDKESFDGCLSFFFDKYVEISQRYDDPQNPYETNLGEWQDDFDELANAIRNVNRIYLLASVDNNERLKYNGALTTSYLYAERLAQKIIDTAPTDIVKAYYYEAYQIFDGISDMTFDCALLIVRNFLRDMGFSLDGSIYMLWEVLTPEFKTFLADASYVILTYIDFDETKTNFDVEKVTKIMASFRELDRFSRRLFRIIDNTNDNSMGLYYLGIQAFLGENISGNALAAANELISVEIAYTKYLISSNADNLTAFKTVMENLISSYGALSEEDLIDFNEYMSTMYQFYLTKYEQLIQPID